MIMDLLKNSSRYLALNSGFAMGFEFLKRPDLGNLPAGRHEIDGERVYAMGVKDHGKKRAEGLLETHNDYIDIQYVHDGKDDLGWKTKSACPPPLDPYDPESDVELFKDTPDAWLETGPGAFAICFPEDAHMPMISSADLHKVVVKVAVEQS